MQLDTQTSSEFIIDTRLTTSSFELVSWPLSLVLLKNNADYPWMILVPKRNNLTEITELNSTDRKQLMDEIYQLSAVMQDFFRPDKMNLGALGNLVAQFHFHVVGRFKHDPLWPQGIWQSAHVEKPYHNPEAIIHPLKKRLVQTFA